jgi:hypothetical protein
MTKTTLFQGKNNIYQGQRKQELAHFLPRILKLPNTTRVKWSLIIPCLLMRSMLREGYKRLMREGI